MSKKILIFTSKEGHLSIAQAISETLRNTCFQTKITDLFAFKSYKVYTPFYRYFPFLFKIPYKIGKKDTVQKAVKLFVEKKLKQGVKKELKNSQPDLIISTNAWYNPAIAKVLDYQKQSIPFINIITDPWKIHPIIFSNYANSNLVYEKKGVKLGLKNKIAKNRLLSIGWLVRKQFYQKQKTVQARKKLNFRKNIPTLLICGGSEGSNMILKIIPALLNIKKPLQVMVVCGTNKILYKALLSFKKLIKKLPKTKVNRLSNISNLLTLKLFKFTDKLPQLMAVSNLIIGKAGPNLIFETVAAQKPFFAICHISGQEDGNLDLIKKKKLGFVEESPIKAIKLLQKIINNPRVLKKFQPYIEKERTYNLQASKKLTKIVKKLLDNFDPTKSNQS